MDDILVYTIKEDVNYHEIVSHKGMRIRKNLGLYYVSTQHYANIKEYIIQNTITDKTYIKNNVYINDPATAVYMCQKFNKERMQDIIDFIEDDEYKE